MLAAADAQAWSWGWNALVACGTLGLALATFYLAVAARKAAVEAAGQSAARWRPVVLPTGAAVNRPNALDGTLSLSIKNVGSGPAIAVEYAIQAPARTNKQVDLPPPLAPGEEISVQIDFALRNAEEGLADVWLGYWDIAGREYQTTFNMRLIDPPTREATAEKSFTDIEFSETGLVQFRGPAPPSGPSFGLGRLWRR